MITKTYTYTNNGTAVSTNPAAPERQTCWRLQDIIDGAVVSGYPITVDGHPVASYAWGPSTVDPITGQLTVKVGGGPLRFATGDQLTITVATPTYQEQAEEAQDAIGWEPGGADCPIVSPVLALARVVVAMAREIDRLTAATEGAADPPAGLLLSPGIQGDTNPEGAGRRETATAAKPRPRVWRGEQAGRRGAGWRGPRRASPPGVMV